MKSDAAPAAREPRLFGVAPALRCCHVRETDPLVFCGHLAQWRGARLPTGAIGFYCDEHRASSDQAIAGEELFRRVCLTVQVFVAAATDRPYVAEGEALELLIQEARRFGGVVNLVAASSEVGRGVFQQPTGKLRMARVGRR